MDAKWPLGSGSSDVEEGRSRAAHQQHDAPFFVVAVRWERARTPSAEIVPHAQRLRKDNGRRWNFDGMHERRCGFVLNLCWACWHNCCLRKPRLGAAEARQADEDADSASTLVVKAPVSLELWKVRLEVAVKDRCERVIAQCRASRDTCKARQYEGRGNSCVPFDEVLFVLAILLAVLAIAAARHLDSSAGFGSRCAEPHLRVVLKLNRAANNRTQTTSNDAPHQGR